MAEAVVEEHATPPTRFFCHMCNVEINIPNTDFTCPLCTGGFVEELPLNAPLPSGFSTVSGNSTTSSGNPNIRRRSSLSSSDLASLLLPRSIEFTVGGAVRGNAGNVSGGRGRGIAIAAGSGGRGNNINGGNFRRGGLFGARSDDEGTTAGGRVHAANGDRFDNVLLEFLTTLTNGEAAGAGGAPLPIGGMPTFYMGNLGDYAWGREGIDTIVTQLLNQMETTGPPPLSADKIAEIPTVDIEADEVETKLQCSVCWEDFQLEEKVRKLPCSHKYHENCIVPWLKLHGTCPICRKTLTAGSSDGVSAVGVDDSQPNFRYETPMVNSTGAAAANSNVGTSQAQTMPMQAQQQTQNQQPHSQRNVFTFEDLQEDLD